MGNGLTREDVAEALAEGTAALQRGAWDEARDLFERAVAAHETPEGLEGLSWAAWWQYDGDAMFQAREAAYRHYRAAGRARDAARMATWLGTDSVDFRGQHAVAEGWFRRARRLLENVPPGGELGWLCIHEAEKRLLANDTVRARELAVEATQLGRQLGLFDLEMLGQATEGLTLITEGAARDGLAKLGEAATAAVADEFAEAWSAGWCCCYMIFGCERARDYDRAAQWCREIDAWTARRRLRLLNRVCRAHYGGILVWRGQWGEAEHVLAQTAAQLADLRTPALAEATVRLGDLRLRQGDFDEARACFERAAHHAEAVLGIGELCLEQGDPAGAKDRAEEYLRDAPPNAVMVRATGLDLLVRARVALGDAPGAEAALVELTTLVSDVAVDPLRASERRCAGIVAAAQGDLDQARVAFEDAVRLFGRGGAPFEEALVRTDLAGVLAQLGRDAEAARQARIAAQDLRALEAGYYAGRAEQLIRQLPGTERAEAPLTAREREVLALVAEGRTNRAIAETLVLSEHTVNRHITNILTKLGATSRSAAVAEAFRQKLI